MVDDSSDEKSTENNEPRESTELTGNQNDVVPSDIFDGSGEVPKQMQSIMTAVMRTGSLPNPMIDKMTSDHVTQVLTLSEAQDTRQFEAFKLKQEAEERTTARRQKYALIIICLMLISLFGLVWMFKDSEDFLLKILALIFTAITSFGGGFGIGRSQRK